MLLGCATNCLPAALPARLALVVAAYSEELSALIAASGRYLSPVFDEGFPDLVRHFWSPQFLREVCGAFNLLSLLFQAIQHLSLRLLLRHKCIALLRQLNSLLCVQSR